MFSLFYIVHLNVRPFTKSKFTKKRLFFSAYINNEINSGKNQETNTYFSCRWGATYRKIDDLSIAPKI